MIKAIGALPKPTTKAIKQPVKEAEKQIGRMNSYEFQLGFVPTHSPGTHKPTIDRVEHFIDQIV